MYQDIFLKQCIRRNYRNYFHHLTYLLKEDRKFRNHIGEIDRVYYITVKFHVINIINKIKLSTDKLGKNLTFVEDCIDTQSI